LFLKDNTEALLDIKSIDKVFPCLCQSIKDENIELDELINEDEDLKQDCHKLNELTDLQFRIQFLTSFLITIINFIFKIVVIKAVKRFGLGSLTE